MQEKRTSEVAEVVSTLLPVSPVETTEQRVARLLAIPLSNLGPDQYNEFAVLAGLMAARAYHWNTLSLRFQEKADASAKESDRVQKLATALEEVTTYLAQMKAPR